MLTSFSIIGGADGPTSIFLAGRLGDGFVFPALFVLIVFYGIYLGKMIAQKKKGIRTDQMARGKKKGRLFYTELLLKIATYTTVLVEVISIFLGTKMFPEPVRYLGIIIAFLGDIIFGLAVWTMRDSWRAGIAENEKTEFVQTGIYKWSRNPAFLGFDLVYIGVVLMFGNGILIIFSVFAMIMLHLQILQEETFLPSLFGEKYTEYKKHTFRYFGYRK